MKGGYGNNNNYGHQSWHETLDKAVKGRQEKGTQIPSNKERSRGDVSQETRKEELKKRKT